VSAEYASGAQLDSVREVNAVQGVVRGLARAHASAARLSPGPSARGGPGPAPRTRVDGPALAPRYGVAVICSRMRGNGPVMSGSLRE
jgi:hypothetical protein